jgi:hypothetical protein
MVKDYDNTLFYIGDDNWELREKTETSLKVVKRYKTQELRETVVYRARCFKDEAEKEFYHM